MLKFIDVVGYTSSKSDKPVILNGIFELTDTFRCGRTKVQELDGETYWIESSLSQAGIYEWSTPDTSDDFDEEVNKVEEPDKDAPEQENAEKEKKMLIDHVVKRGETMQSIAEMYSVTTQWLMSHIGSSSVFVGQHIVVYEV